MKVDLTVTISAILGMSAIVAPVLTALINNHHQTKIKKLELAHEKYTETALYQRRILENYMQATAKCLIAITTNAEIEYAECYGLAVLYVPAEIQKKLEKLDAEIKDKNLYNARLYFTELTPILTDIIQKL